MPVPTGGRPGLDLFGLLDDLRARADRAEAEATAATNEFIRIEAEYVRNRATLGDREWAWLEMCLAVERFEVRSEALEVASQVVMRLVEKRRFRGGGLGREQ